MASEETQEHDDHTNQYDEIDDDAQTVVSSPSAYSSPSSSPRTFFRPHRVSRRSSKHATLGNGGVLESAFILPEGVDENDWLSVNMVDIYNNVSQVYGTLTEFCLPNKDTCKSMNAGAKYEYLWADHDRVKKPIHCSAVEYANYLFDWIDDQFTDENVFPTQPGHPYPRHFKSIIQTMCKKLFRIYAHMYKRHEEHIELLQIDAHMNSSLKAFLFFAETFDLIDAREVSPLKDEIHGILGRPYKSLPKSFPSSRPKIEYAQKCKPPEISNENVATPQSVIYHPNDVNNNAIDEQSMSISQSPSLGIINEPHEREFVFPDDEEGDDSSKPNPSVNTPDEIKQRFARLRKKFLKNENENEKKKNKSKNPMVVVEDDDGLPSLPLSKSESKVVVGISKTPSPRHYHFESDVTRARKQVMESEMKRLQSENDELKKENEKLKKKLEVAEKYIEELESERRPARPVRTYSEPMRRPEISVHVDDEQANLVTPVSIITPSPTNTHSPRTPIVKTRRMDESIPPPPPPPPPLPPSSHKKRSSKRKSRSKSPRRIPKKTQAKREQKGSNPSNLSRQQMMEKMAKYSQSERVMGSRGVPSGPRISRSRAVSSPKKMANKGGHFIIRRKTDKSPPKRALPKLPPLPSS